VALLLCHSPPLFKTGPWAQKRPYHPRMKKTSKDRGSQAQAANPQNEKSQGGHAQHNNGPGQDHGKQHPKQDDRDPKNPPRLQG